MSLPWSFVLIAATAFLQMFRAEAANNNAHARLDREWRNKKAKCEAERCIHLKLPEEGENCVNECISSRCYQEVYATNPLEDGEFDNVRSRSFTTCLRKEIKETHAATRAAARGL